MAENLTLMTFFILISLRVRAYVKSNLFTIMTYFNLTEFKLPQIDLAGHMVGTLKFIPFFILITSWLVIA